MIRCGVGCRHWQLRTIHHRRTDRNLPSGMTLRSSPHRVVQYQYLAGQYLACHQVAMAKANMRIDSFDMTSVRHDEHADVIFECQLLVVTPLEKEENGILIFPTTSATYISTRTRHLNSDSWCQTSHSVSSAFCMPRPMKAITFFFFC